MRPSWHVIDPDGRSLWGHSVAVHLCESVINAPALIAFRVMMMMTTMMGWTVCFWQGRGTDH